MESTEVVRERKERKPWDQMKDEPDLWYHRFEIFRMMEHHRSVSETFRIAKVEDTNLFGQAPGSKWRINAKKWKWVERAHAWDDHLREQTHQEEEKLALERRTHRLGMIQSLQVDAYEALKTVNLDDMTEEQARAFFPQIRMLFIGLIQAERIELGGAVAEDGEKSSELPNEIIQSLAKAYGTKVVVTDGSDIAPGD